MLAQCTSWLNSRKFYTSRWNVLPSSEFTSEKDQQDCEGERYLVIWKIVEKMLWNEMSSHHDIEQQWELEPWSLNFWTKALTIKLRLQPFALKSICDWVFASFLDGEPFDGSRSGIRRGYWADLPRT